MLHWQGNHLVYIFLREFHVEPRLYNVVKQLILHVDTAAPAHRQDLQNVLVTGESSGSYLSPLPTDDHVCRKPLQ